jgi:hypothetical protein
VAPARWHGVIGGGVNVEEERCLHQRRVAVVVSKKKSGANVGVEEECRRHRSGRGAGVEWCQSVVGASLNSARGGGVTSAVAREDEVAHSLHGKTRRHGEDVACEVEVCHRKTRWRIHCAVTARRR